MSFLMQNHVFYRSFLVWQLRMKALQSGADDNKNGLQNRPKIDEKWSQNGSQNRSFFQWLRRRLSASILERFGTILGSMLRRFWGPKSIQKHLERTSNNYWKSHAGFCSGLPPKGGGSALTEIQWSLTIQRGCKRPYEHAPKCPFRSGWREALCCAGRCILEPSVI